MRPIAYSKELEVSGDHLYTRWSRETLVVPEELESLLTSLGVRSAEQFASMLVTHPSSLLAAGVEATHVLSVRDEVLEELSEKLDKKLLMAPTFRPKTGARNPF